MTTPSPSNVQLASAPPTQIKIYVKWVNDPITHFVLMPFKHWKDNWSLFIGDNEGWEEVEYFLFHDQNQMDEKVVNQIKSLSID